MSSRKFNKNYLLIYLFIMWSAQKHKYFSLSPEEGGKIIIVIPVRPPSDVFYTSLNINRINFINKPISMKWCRTAFDMEQQSVLSSTKGISLLTQKKETTKDTPVYHVRRDQFKKGITKRILCLWFGWRVKGESIVMAANAVKIVLWGLRWHEMPFATTLSAQMSRTDWIWKTEVYT